MENIDYLLEHENQISYILNNPNDSKQYIESLQDMPDYKNNQKFKLVCDTSICLYYELVGEYEKAFNLSRKNIRLGEKLDCLKLLSFNLNTQGIVYSLLVMTGLSFDTLMKLIKLEEENNFIHSSDAAYANIAELFLDLRSDEAYEWNLKAWNFINDNKDRIKRYENKAPKILSSLIVSMCYADRLDEIDEYFDELICLDDRYPNNYNKTYVCDAKVNYYFAIGLYRKAYDSFLEGIEICKMIDYDEFKFKFIINYRELCLSKSEANRRYLEEIEKMEFEYSDILAEKSAKILEQLITYYKMFSITEKLPAALEKYFYYSRLSDEKNRERNISMINIGNEILFQKRENNVIKEKNRELKELAEQLDKNRMALEKYAYNMDSLAKIGRKINSTLNIREVVNEFYIILKETIDISSFAFFVAEDSRNIFKSIVFYENDILCENVDLPINDNNLISKCYKTENKIISNDIKVDMKKIGLKLNAEGDESLNSLIYFAVVDKREKLGVFTLQSKNKNAYKEDDIEFIDSLKPYISSALNNAIYSEALKEEIEAHKKTHNELKALNHKLKMLSSLDGLTNVRNKRSFNDMYVEFASKAIRERKSISIFLLDIDFFKRYNDTYGHLKGDDVLKTIASSLANFFEDDDYVFARFGGEEFIATCIGLSFQQTNSLGEALRKEIHDLKILNENTELGYLTVSVGALHVENIDDSYTNEYIEYADNLLYEAKKSGRNIVVCKEIKQMLNS